VSGQTATTDAACVRRSASSASLPAAGLNPIANLLPHHG